MVSSSLPLSRRSRSALPSVRLRGVALIEVIVFMVVVATAVGGLLSVFANTNRGSAQLLVERQALAIAEAILNEVLAAPFTVCDPEDTNFLGPGACTSLTESVTPLPGPEPGETRLGVAPFLRPFDNVNDYHNLNFAAGAGITDRAGLTVPASQLYSLGVTVVPVNLAGAGITVNEMLLITVTVTTPVLHGPVVLQGMRSRYAPRTKPL